MEHIPNESVACCKHSWIWDGMDHLCNIRVIAKQNKTKKEKENKVDTYKVSTLCKDSHVKTPTEKPMPKNLPSSLCTV